MIHSNGDYYEGEFRANQAHGYGKYVSKTGFCYEGEWENDVMNDERH